MHAKPFSKPYTPDTDLLKDSSLSRTVRKLNDAISYRARVREKTLLGFHGSSEEGPALNAHVRSLCIARDLLLAGLPGLTEAARRLRPLEEVRDATKELFTTGRGTLPESVRTYLRTVHAERQQELHAKSVEIDNAELQKRLSNHNHLKRYKAVGNLCQVMYSSAHAAEWRASPDLASDNAMISVTRSILIYYYITEFLPGEISATKEKIDSATTHIRTALEETRSALTKFSSTTEQTIDSSKLAPIIKAIDQAKAQFRPTSKWLPTEAEGDSVALHQLSLAVKKLTDEINPLIADGLKKVTARVKNLADNVRKSKERVLARRGRAEGEASEVPSSESEPRTAEPPVDPIPEFVAHFTSRLSPLVNPHLQLMADCRECSVSDRTAIAKLDDRCASFQTDLNSTVESLASIRPATLSEEELLENLPGWMASIANGKVPLEHDQGYAAEDFALLAEDVAIHFGAEKPLTGKRATLDDLKLWLTSESVARKFLHLVEKSAIDSRAGDIDEVLTEHLPPDFNTLTAVQQILKLHPELLFDGSGSKAPFDRYIEALGKTLPATAPYRDIFEFPDDFANLPALERTRGTVAVLKAVDQFLTADPEHEVSQGSPVERERSAVLARLKRAGFDAPMVMAILHGGFKVGARERYIGTKQLPIVHVQTNAGRALNKELHGPATDRFTATLARISGDESCPVLSGTDRNYYSLNSNASAVLVPALREALSFVLKGIKDSAYIVKPHTYSLDEEQ